MLKYLLVILSLTGAALSQNLRYDNVASGPRGPIPNALIAVCTQPANTNAQPCTPLAPLCSSITDTTCTSSNPLQADGLGNYHFYVKSSVGTFTVQTYGPQVIAPYVQTDQGTIPGTVAFLNGVYNAATCATSAPSWCSGTDIGGWINAAASACSGTCVITIPPGTYSYSTTPTINKPGLSVVGAGVNATFLNYTGTGDAFRVQMNPFSVTQAGRLEGMTIQCTGACLGTTANGLHEGDVTGYRMIDLHIYDFTGSTSACLWTDNNLGWTERNTEQSVWLDTCTILHKWTNTNNTQTTSSFGHWPLIDERWNLVGSATGWSVTSGLIYDDGFISVTGNAQNSNTFFSVSGTQYSGGAATAVSAASWSEQVESDSGTNTLFSTSGGASLVGCGYFNTFGLSVSYSGILIGGSNCPLQNGAFYSALNTSNSADGIIGLNSSNQTIIKGDSSGAAIIFQPNGSAAVASVLSNGINMTALLCGAAAPTITSGFNTGSINTSNGTCSFSVLVGTGSAGSTGVIGLPTAAHGWNCYAFNATHPGAIILESAGSASSATLTNYGTTPGTPVNWTNSDGISVSCFAN